MDAWYVVFEGKPAGPFTLEELKDLSIDPGTFIKSSLMEDFKEAHEIPEIRELLGLKYRVTLPQYFATLDLRLLAAAIDYLIITAGYVVLALFIVLLSSSQFFKLAVALSGVLIIITAKFIYACIMEASSRQGTFGKFWLGLKVCDEKGLPINLNRSFIRNLSKILSKLSLGIGYLSGFFNKKQQCLHDLVAGTLVIKDRLI